MIKEKIKKWLDIKPPDQVEKVKDWKEDFEKLEAELWKYTHLVKKQAKTTCPVCKKQLLLWPLEKEAYYTKDGDAYHVKCYVSKFPTPKSKKN